jgi:hypothetical protein
MSAQEKTTRERVADVYKEMYGNRYESLYLPWDANSRAYDPTDPSYYKRFFGFDEENTPYEALYQDDHYGEYIQVYGHHFDVYLMTSFNPDMIFGEDPVKKYESPSFLANGIWELTPEKLQMGKWEQNTENESIIVYMHRTTVKESIKKNLSENGFIDDIVTIDDDLDKTKLERHRLELQEGDIIKSYFNNIHYEIDGIKLEPEYQHHLYKYVYEIHAKPRLVSGENLGEMQPVTDAEEIRMENVDAIVTESNKLLF